MKKQKNKKKNQNKDKRNSSYIRTGPLGYILEQQGDIFNIPPAPRWQ